MPVPTPFHPRTSALCTSYRWRAWAGYHAVASFDTCHEPEYMAIRHAAGLMDVTPLYKYDVEGKDAGALLARVMVRDIRKLKVGQVTYCCWCDGHGKVIDDGTVTRWEENKFRVTAAAPTYHWLDRNSRGFEVVITDVSSKIGILAVQGPTSRDILKSVVGAQIQDLKFFRGITAKIGASPVWVTRTGYTGDLGYEVWTENAHALKVWDALMEGGKPHGIRPHGLDALDVARVEAAFIMLDVDYYSAKDCVIESRKSTPDEIGLGWTVHLDREPFIGQDAIKAERAEGSKLALAGLDIDWLELESLFARFGLPPQVPGGAWRVPVPVYLDGEQIGKATSGAWSPMLKKNLALATIKSEFAAVGTEVQIEVTAEFERSTITARVVDKPFFNPERKRK